jgi:hypothetical protein
VRSYAIGRLRIDFHHHNDPMHNPTLTIVALAIRQADYIADQMAKRAI